MGVGGVLARSRCRRRKDGGNGDTVSSIINGEMSAGSTMRAAGVGVTGGLGGGTFRGAGAQGCGLRIMSIGLNAGTRTLRELVFWRVSMRPMAGLDFSASMGRGIGKGRNARSNRGSRAWIAGPSLMSEMWED